jgi:anti-sigma B factor antagonist
VQIGEIETGQPEAGIAVLTVSGEHDLNTAPQLREQLERQIEAGSGLIIDLSPATFVDSTILGVILEARRRAIGSGLGFAVVHGDGSAAVVRVLEITGLRSELPVHGDLDAGLHAVRSGGGAAPSAAGPSPGAGP